MNNQEFYLIPKSYFDSRKENIQLEILHCQEHQNHVDEEKATIELATIYEAIGNSKLIDLSDEAMETKADLDFDASVPFLDHYSAHRGGYKNALKDLKINIK